MIGTIAQCITYLANLKDDKRRYEVKRYREKRSLNQNAYYWKLLGEVAKITRIDSMKIHNGNLRALGLTMRVDRRLVTTSLPDTAAAGEWADTSPTVHLLPTSQTRTGRDGVVYRTYILLRGSSTFDTEEMSALLDLMIQEAEQQGIETITPDERERMRQYEKRHNTAG